MNLRDTIADRIRREFAGEAATDGHYCTPEFLADKIMLDCVSILAVSDDKRQDSGANALVAGVQGARDADSEGNLTLREMHLVSAGIHAALRAKPALADPAAIADRILHTHEFAKPALQPNALADECVQLVDGNLTGGEWTDRAEHLLMRAANALRAKPDHPSRDYWYNRCIEAERQVDAWESKPALTSREREHVEADYLREERVARAFHDDRRTRLASLPSWDALPEYDKDELRHHARVAVFALVPALAEQAQPCIECGLPNPLCDGLTVCVKCFDAAQQAQPGPALAEPCACEPFMFATCWVNGCPRRAALKETRDAR